MRDDDSPLGIAVASAVAKMSYYRARVRRSRTPMERSVSETQWREAKNALAILLTGERHDQSPHRRG